VSNFLKHTQNARLLGHTKLAMASAMAVYISLQNVVWMGVIACTATHRTQALLVTEFAMEETIYLLDAVWMAEIVTNAYKKHLVQTQINWVMGFVIYGSIPLHAIMTVKIVLV